LVCYSRGAAARVDEVDGAKASGGIGRDWEGKESQGG
jgi:hypothetical protein